MVAREVLPDRGSRKRKHHDLAPLEVTRNERPAALISATSIRPAAGDGKFRISTSVKALRTACAPLKRLARSKALGTATGTQNVPTAPEGRRTQAMKNV